MSDYYQFQFQRNNGYINANLQQKLREIKITIAGCGIGSSAAEALVRMGCENLTLVDKDTVSTHNLNRQTYQKHHIGHSKSSALKDHLLLINENANITVINEYINEKNAPEILSGSDFIFDTIDFLDLNGICALHDYSQSKKIPVISSLAIGWGAGSFVFNEQSTSFRDLFKIPLHGNNEKLSYKKVFSSFLKNISVYLDPTVNLAVAKALEVMEDGKPCPASQVSPGASCVAALSGYLLTKYLTGEQLPLAPQMVFLDLPNIVRSNSLNTMSA